MELYQVELLSFKVSYVDDDGSKALQNTVVIVFQLLPTMF